MKRYAIREIFATLQGEGVQAGTPAIFLRFAGCNLGYEVCPWCDTDWAKAHYRLDVDETLDFVKQVAEQRFGADQQGLLLVATGGEPSLQFDQPLSDALRAAGFRIAMETNGSREIDRTLVDWLTVSPKQVEFVQRQGDELKVVFTGRGAAGIAPTVAAVRQLAAGTEFDHYVLQPLDHGPRKGGSAWGEATHAVMQLGAPWRLSIQVHKVIGLR